MGLVKKGEKSKLIVGFISSNKELFNKTERCLSKKFGPIDYESEILSFEHTDYYKKEMGSVLFRKFISFKNLIFPDRMPEIKIFTNKTENKFCDASNNRKINIDPGYITKAKLVLATTKDYQHRIYLNKGIYAEITLKYKKGGFCPLEWTFPDYRTDEYISIFNKIRQTYCRQS